MNSIIRKNDGLANALAKYRKGNFLILVALAAMMVLNTKSLCAATYYWDANGNTAGTGGSGTWSSATFSSSSGGTSGSGQNPTSADTVEFNATGGTVTLPSATWSTTNVGTMRFNANYILTNSGSTTVTITNASTVLANNVNLTLTPGTSADMGFRSGVMSGGTGSVLTLSNNSTGTRIVRLNNYDISNTIAVNLTGTGGGIIGFYEAGGSSSIKANVTNNSVNSFNIGAGSGNVLSVDGVISGSGKVNIGYGATSGGAGRVTLNNANTYTGDTVVVMSATGTLRIGTNNAISTGSVVQHGTSGTGLGGAIDLYGNNQTVAGLASGASAAGRITNSLAGASTLTVNQASDTSYGLAIGGNLALTKSGAGNLSLTASNNYTGNTTVSGGILSASNNSALGGSSVSVGSGATLSVRANITNAVANSGTVSIGAGGTLTATTLGSGALSLVGANGAGNTAAFISTQADSSLSIGSLTLGGYSSLSMASDKSLSAGTITLSGTNNSIFLTGSGLSSGTYNLITGSSISSGSLASGGLTLGGAGVGNGTVVLNGSQTTVGRTTYDFTSTSTALQLVVGGGAWNVVWNGGDGAWDTSATNWQKDGLGANLAFFGNDNVTLSAANTITADSAGITAGTLTANNSSGTAILKGGNISASSLSKSGAGALVISNAVTAINGITQSAGTLTTVGNLTISNTGVNLSGGTANLNGSNNIVSGGLTVAGGTATLNGSNTISAGGLNISSGSLTVNSTNNIIGGLNVTGGTATINSSNSITGGVNANGGVLVVNANGALGNNAIVMNGGSLGSGTLGTLTNAVTLGASGGSVTNDAALTLSGGITGTGNTLSKRGSGDLGLSGAVGAAANGISLNVQDGRVVLSGSTAKYVTNSTINGNLVVSNTALWTRGSTFGGSGLVQIAGTSQWSNNTSQSYISNTVALQGGANFTSSNASSTHLHLLGGLVGTGNVTTAGNGGLYVYGNGFSGEITNNAAGDLRFLNADVSGITAFRSVTGSALLFSNSTADRTVGGVISGSQALSIRGTGMTTFTNAQSDFTNNIDINGSTGGTTAKFVGNSMGSATATAEISLGGTNTLHLDGVTSVRNLGMKSGGGTIRVDGDSSLGNLTNNTAGGQSLTKEGNGKLTFTGLVRDDSTTNAPVLNIKAGRVTLAASSATAQYISVAGTTTNYAGDLEISAGNQLGIHGSGTMGGGGKLIFSGNDSALQTSSSSANNGAVLNIANDIVLTGGAGTKANLVATTSNTIALNQVQGTGDLYFGIQSAGGGSGQIQLKDILSFTGNVYMNLTSNGVVRLDSANVLGNNQRLIMNRNVGSGIVDFNGNNQSLVSLESLNNDVTYTGVLTSANAATLSLNQDSNTTYGGTIDGALAVVKNGTGILTLAASNSMSGGVTINGGGIYLTNSSKGVGSGTLTMNGGRLAALASGYILTNSVVISADSSFGKTDGSGNLMTLSGGVDLNGGSRVITLDNSLTVSGVISNGTLILDSTLNRNLNISGASTYAGGTTVRGGNLRLTNSGSLNSLGALNLAATTGAANLDISGLTGSGTTIGSLAGAANSTVALGAKNLNVGGNDTSTTYAGAISGAGGSLTKGGSGSLILTGNNSYTGATTVNGGILEVASGGSIAASAAAVNNGAILDVEGTAGAVTVNNGGRLEGSGSVGALTIASGGTLAVGNSPGALTASSATWNGGGTYSWELASAAGNDSSFLSGQGSQWDFLNVTGVLDIAASSGNQFIIDIVSLLAFNDTTFNQDNSYSFAIATAAGGITSFDGGDFSITGYLSGSNKWSLGLVNNTGSSQSLLLSYSGATAIPEPSTGALLLVGLLGAIAGRRRRHNT